MNQARYIFVGFIGVLIGTTFMFLPLENGDAATSQARQAPRDVTVITVHERDIARTEAFPGRTTASRIAQVRPQVTGIITKRLFSEGALVEEGQQLYQIDDAVYVVSLKEAEASLAQAKATQLSAARLVKRLTPLIEAKSVSQQVFDDAEVSLAQADAAVALAEARVSGAELDLQYTKVKAPISGRIGRSAVTEGALVTENQSDALATITQLDPIYVDIQKPGAGNNNSYDPATTSVKLMAGPGMPNYMGEGTLQFSDVLVDPSTGSIQLRAIFPNPDQILLPGMFVTAEITSGEQNGLLVPQNAVVRDETGKAYVWQIDSEQVAHKSEVVTDRAINNQWLVTDGIHDGDLIVTEGMHRLAPNTPVRTHKVGE